MFYLNDFLKNKEVFHLARVQIHSRQDLSLHCHDFAEIFWVEGGKGAHLINGHKQSLNPGDLVMIRPKDQHTFSSRSGGVTLMNLAFGTETVDFLLTRYFEETHSFFWSKDVLPFQMHFDENVIKRISQRAVESMTFCDSNLHLDSLLLFIFRLVQSVHRLEVIPDLPNWLSKAIYSFNTPENFKKGSMGFVTICDRNGDHVNRVIKQKLNKTLSNLVTELRMVFASRQLAITNTPIKMIAADCGYNNIGHFYVLFNNAFHQTPSQYRKMNQTIC